MAYSRQVDIDLAWHWAGRPTGEALADQVARLVGADPAEVRTGRHCPSCGSDAHGRPWARVGSREVAVSLSRAGGRLVTAASVRHESIGVDIEVIDDVEGRWEPGIVLHPDDPADTDPAWAWCAKEAVLKAAGTGLQVPMTDVRLADHRVLTAQAPPGLACVVAVLPLRPEAAPGASPRRARHRRAAAGHDPQSAPRVR